MTKKSKRITKLTPEVLKELDQEALVSIVMKLYEQNVQLSEQLQAFINEKYGRKTERHEDEGQLRLFDQPGEKATDSSPADDQTNSAPRKKPGHSRNPMPSHLQKLPIRRDPTADELTCKCGGRRHKVNEVVRNKRFECIPATLRVEEIIDGVWQCPDCNDTIVVAASPLEPIPNGSAGPRLLCKIAEDRWLNHMPYYRQEQAFARIGVDISRSTMCGWMSALATIFAPIYQGMRMELLKSRIIATDDTPVKVQDRSKKSNIKRGHEWIFRGDSEHPVKPLSLHARQEQSWSTEVHPRVQRISSRRLLLRQSRLVRGNRRYTGCVPRSRSPVLQESKTEQSAAC